MLVKTRKVQKQKYKGTIGLKEIMNKMEVANAVGFTKQFQLPYDVVSQDWKPLDTNINQETQ